MSIASEKGLQEDLKFNKKLSSLKSVYDKLVFLSDEIGFDILIDYIITIIISNTSKTDKISFCENKLIEDNIKEILKQVSEEELFIYLMKILTIGQKKTIEKETEFKLSLDSK